MMISAQNIFSTPIKDISDFKSLGHFNEIKNLIKNKTNIEVNARSWENLFSQFKQAQELALKSPIGFDENDVEDIPFFKSQKDRLAFLILHNRKGIFNEELGIKRVFYVDKKKANQWRKELLHKFHPDVNNGSSAKKDGIDFNEITHAINEMYYRITGEHK